MVRHSLLNQSPTGDVPVGRYYFKSSLSAMRISIAMQGLLHIRGSVCREPFDPAKKAHRSVLRSLDRAGQRKEFVASKARLLLNR